MIKSIENMENLNKIDLFELYKQPLWGYMVELFDKRGLVNSLLQRFRTAREARKAAKDYIQKNPEYVRFKVDKTASIYLPNHMLPPCNGLVVQFENDSYSRSHFVTIDNVQVGAYFNRICYY